MLLVRMTHTKKILRGTERNGYDGSNESLNELQIKKIPGSDFMGAMNSLR